MSTTEAMKQFTKSMQEDDDYAWSWHCNLAMSAQDNGVDHKAANKSAALFMKWCFNVDMTKHPHYIDIMEETK